MSKAKLQIVIEALKKNPNVSASVIARKLGTKKGYTYALMSKARKEIENEELAEALINGGPTAEELKGIDLVNHPPHYTQGGIETIDFIEAKQLGYNLGNVVKYITRSAHKGARRQDLEKAQWYLTREIANLSR
jgi:hypothetical protein